MKLKLKLAVAVAVAVASLPAFAHVSYTNRDLGTFSGLSAASNSITNQVTYNYGWADAADGDWGDSHKGKFFKFTLSGAANVTLSAWANPTATGASIAGLLPAFSLYQGLAVPSAYDTSAGSSAYRGTLGFPTEGAMNALGNVTMYNDGGSSSTLTFVGYAADQGVVDGTVSKMFSLGAGSYTLWVGGANYAGQFAALPLSTYGLGVGIGVAPVPEPETYAMLLAGLGLMGVVVRRRRAIRAD
jgi:hypothetical protein